MNNVPKCRYSIKNFTDQPVGRNHNIRILDVLNVSLCFGG